MEDQIVALELRNRWRNQGDVWWDWEAFLDDHGSKELRQVESVDYVLHPTFARPVRQVADPEGGFVLRAGGLGGFALKAFARMKDGSSRKFVHKLQLRYEPTEGESVSEAETNRILQDLLAKAGSYDGPIDGAHGARTEEAVRTFQREHGLRVDGFAGPATWRALQGRSVEPFGSDRKRSVMYLQACLKKLELYEGPLDGLYGRATEAAVTQFQRLRGLEVDGVAGSQTWAALGERGMMVLRTNP
jgi:hypothetical protein